MRIWIGLAMLTLSAMAADNAAVDAFVKRTEEYAKVRDAAKKKVPVAPNNATPEQIAKYEDALVTEIRAARSAAKQGDVFTPDVELVFRQILKSSLGGERHTDARAAIKEGNPQHDRGADEKVPVIAVNAAYPKSAPLSTVPPLLLLELPKLPKDIEYRFSGRTLLLWDNISNLIIDYIKEASPAQ